MYIFEWCTLLKCSSKCPCTCILTVIINISNKIGSILTNCMSNECIHTHSNLAKSGIWSIDCEIWDMGYWGVKNLGYGILGVKILGYGIWGGYKFWDMGYGHPCVTPPPYIYTAPHQVETDRAFMYARRSTYDICCIFAVTLFTSIFPSNDRQIWYNSQIIELLILKLITINNKRPMGLDSSTEFLFH